MQVFNMSKVLPTNGSASQTIGTLMDIHYDMLDLVYELPPAGKAVGDSGRTKSDVELEVMKTMLAATATVSCRRLPLHTVRSST
jgi:hypothetical protein